MKVSEVMTPECDVCRGSDTVATVAKLMALKGIGFVPVAEGDKMIGTVTDRDIVVRGIATGKDLCSAPVAELMSDDVFYCFDDQDCSDIAANMAELQVRRLPVVNRDKRLVGTVALGDLERGGADAEAHRAHAGITQDL